MNFIFFIKLRIRGLGYRIRSICPTVHYIFFNYTNYYYFFHSNFLITKIYRKRMLLISFNWSILKLVVSHLLLLYRFGPYTLYGFKVVKQIVLLKKSGKKI
jgi:hypothetical protein